MPSTADVIAGKLFDAGCRHAFGIPGGEVLTIMDALVRAGITFTLAKHENAAGFMAEGVHHATCSPVILLATIGPGVANAVNVIANAYQDRVPLVVLTGCVDDIESISYTHQVLDQQALLRPITKGTFRAVTDGSDIIVDKAIAIARDGRPGPVHIDIPISVAKQAHRPIKPMRGPATRSRPSEDASLLKARNLFGCAQEPVIVAGLDVINESEAASSLQAFAERHHVPVLTTYKAKGVIPEDHPLCLGGHGLSPLADKYVLPYLQTSDCILSVGYDPIEMRIGWRDPWTPEKVVEFVAEANRHDMHYAQHAWRCGIIDGLAALDHGLTPTRTGPTARAVRLRADLKEVFSARRDWGPDVAFDVLRKSVPRNTVITVDSGAHRILLSQQWECYRERGLLQSSALCTMGCSLPLAIGYKFASPGTPVLAVMGDAGLEMVAGELATLRDLKLPVIICVMVDRSLTLIEMKQRGSQLPNLGVDFGATDFVAVARAFGGYGANVADQTSLKREVSVALERTGVFTLLAIEIGARAYESCF